MAGRGNCHRTGVPSAGEAQGNTVEKQETQQTMRMCRHVHTMPAYGGVGVERQLSEVQRLMCEQNRILAELLRAVREQNG